MSDKPVPLPLLHMIYNALRCVEKYADWDMDGYDECVTAKNLLGEILWPDVWIRPPDE